MFFMKGIRISDPHTVLVRTDHVYELMTVIQLVLWKSLVRNKYGNIPLVKITFKIQNFMVMETVRVIVLFRTPMKYNSQILSVLDKSVAQF